jgi:hypothetical protein
MSLTQIREQQKENLNIHILALVELQRQAESARDLAQSPSERARFDAETTRIRHDIDRYKRDLEEIELENKNSQLVAEGRRPILESYRVKLDDDLPETRLNDQFQREVRDILNVLKYEITPEMVLGLPSNSPPTFVAIQDGDFEPVRALIQCMYAIVDDNGLLAFRSIYDHNRSALRLRQAVMITNTFVSPSARRLAGEHQIQLLTFEELLNTVFRVTSYLKDSCQRFEDTNKLYHTYVELKYLRRGAGRFTDNRLTLEESLAAEDPGGSWFEAKGDLTPYVDAWLLTPGEGQICLLGEYGTGKTSFAAHYFWKRSNAYLKDPLRNRIPLFIPLGRFHKSADMEQMITAFLVNECGIRRDFKTFLSMAARGKFVLILDGFDEMAKQVDVSVRRHNFREISRVLVGNNKVILSGRPNYFLSQDELAELFGQAATTDPYRAALRSATSEGAPRYQILNVTLFDRWQISDFLQKQAAFLQKESSDNWRALENVIYTTYNLEELARTPVLLEIIIKTVSELRGKVTDINAAKLYEIYTNFWLDREYDKGDVRWLVTRQDKELFVLELAWSMLLTDHTRPEIHFSALSSRVREYFLLDRASDIDYFSSDIRFCSYLVHSPQEGAIDLFTNLSWNTSVLGGFIMKSLNGIICPA